VKYNFHREIKLSLFLFSISVVTIIVLWGFLVKKSSNSQPAAQKGVIDLRNWNFETNGPVLLNGEWEFFWQKRLNPAENFNETVRNPEYIHVPKLWNNHKIDGKNLSSKGFATYRLKILINPQEEKYSLFIKDIQTSHELFIDNEKFYSLGSLGKTEETTIPKVGDKKVDFFIHKNYIILSIPVANFHRRYGGLKQALEFGLEKDIKEKIQNKILITLFFLGSIFFVGIFCFSFYLMRKKEKYLFYLAIISLVIIIRQFSLPDVLSFALKSYDYFLSMKLNYITFYMGVSFFALFLHNFFPHVFKKNTARIYYYSGFFSSFLTLFVPEFYASLYLVRVFHFIALIFLINIIYCLIIALKEKKEGSVLFLSGFLFLSYALTNDILLNTNWIQSAELTYLGFFIFLYFQTSLLIIKYSANYKTIKNQNEILKNLLYQRDFFKSAAKTAEDISNAKSRFLARMSHEIRTPLNAILGITDLMLNTKLSKKQNEYIKTIQNTGSHLEYIINDIIDISKIEKEKMNIHLEKFDFFNTDKIGYHDL